MKILITGATGLIGKELGKSLVQNGHKVIAVSRNSKKARESLPFPCEIIQHDLEKKELGSQTFKDIDGIIHLAGENIGEGRWNQSRKEAIIKSRVSTTENLLKNAPGIKFFISANAIGYYGDRGDEVLSEQSSAGKGFLADVCKSWEQAASQFKTGSLKNTRFAFIRIGIVLSQQGGALDKLRQVFQMRIGGPVGSGKQWMSWIHINDLISIFNHVIENEQIEGPINAVAPNPVTNYDFSKTLAKVLNVPLLPAVPGAALKLLLGEMAALVLSSQNVTTKNIPKSLFKFNELELALGDLCKVYQDGDSYFYAEQFLPFSIEKVFDFFSKAENLEKMTPPHLNFHILSKSTPDIRKGTLIEYKLKIHGVPIKWKTLIEEFVDGEYFVDNQLKGPYSKWHHTHSFYQLGEGTLMVDKVKYRLPMGFLGSLVGGRFVLSDIQKIFEFRKSQILKLLA